MRTFDAHVMATGVRTEVALLVYTEESNLDPHVSSGSAWGLAQINAGTLKDIGWTDPPAEFGKLGVGDQAPWIQKLLEYQTKIIGFTPTNALDLFTANLSPAAARSKSIVIYDSNDPSQAAYYKGNKGLDRDKKGYITRNDLALVLTELETSETYMRAIDQLRRIHGG